jgi:hypothetical protein
MPRQRSNCFLASSQISKLVEPNSWHDTKQQNQSSDQDGPQLDLQHILVEVCLCRKSNSCQHGEQDHVSTNTVVLVQLLGIRLAAVQLRYEVLRDTNHCL